MRAAWRPFLCVRRLKVSRLASSASFTAVAPACRLASANAWGRCTSRAHACPALAGMATTCQLKAVGRRAALAGLLVTLPLSSRAAIPTQASSHDCASNASGEAEPYGRVPGATGGPY